MAGKLFIVGIGPGDPELVTIRAAAILRTVQYVFIPLAGKGKESLAYAIAKNYIQQDAVISELTFAMVQDKDILHASYLENYRKLESVLRKDSDAALITLGDPGTYSTAWQIVALFKNRAPDILVEIIPGVTSYADAAARSEITLAEGNDILSVVSSYDSIERINTIIDSSDTVVFLKTYKKRSSVIELLKTKGLFERCIYIRRCGLRGEKIIHDLRQIPEDNDYFSMIILKKRA